MALTESNMLPIGTKAPYFELQDTVSGSTLNYNDVAGTKGTIVVFSCNHCPFVIHVNDEIVRMANDYRTQGFGFVAISSNDIEKYPQDAPEHMWKIARKKNYTFPYLFDETQEIAKAYDAACTPDFYLFDAELKLIYRGQLDDSRPGNGIPVNGRDLRNAMDAVLRNAKVPEPQKPSIGCNIKWKS